MEWDEVNSPNWKTAPEGAEYFDTRNEVWYKKTMSSLNCRANKGSGWYGSTFSNEILDTDSRFKKRPRFEENTSVGYSWDEAPLTATHRCPATHVWYRPTPRIKYWQEYGVQSCFPGNSIEKWRTVDMRADQLNDIQFELQKRPTQTQTPEVIKMSNAKPFDTKHYVFGQDVSGMAGHELISAIQKVEAEIATLKSIKVASTKITAKVAELEAMLGDIVKVLDAQ